MSARDAILADIRKALGREVPVDSATRAALEARLAGHKVNLVPQRGQVRGREGIEAFVRMAEFSLATVRRVRGVVWMLTRRCLSFGGGSGKRRRRRRR